MAFTRPPAADDPHWPRAAAWLDRDDRQPLVEVIGVPSSVGSISPSDAWSTPPEIRAALQRLSPFEPATRVDLDASVPIRDGGDWPVADLDVHAMVTEVARRAAALAGDAGGVPVRVFLGGDNAITRPLAAGLCGPDLSRVGVLTLDAHHDVRHLGDGPRNGTPIRGLIDEEGLPGANVAQVGIGWFTNSRPYRDWCDEHGIRTILAEQVHRDGIDACIDDALAHLAHCDRIYVDLDIDVVDVASAPACPGARPGGISPTDLLVAARRLGAKPNVVAADVVEVDAHADHDGRTVMLAAMAVLAFAAGVAAR